MKWLEARENCLMKFHNFYSSVYIIRVIRSSRMRWAGFVARYGELRDAYKISVAKRGERPRERSWHRGEDNIRKNLREIW